MAGLPVVAIFDIGKTNKKLFLFNEQYEIVYEECTQFSEIKDEDGFECEDVHALSQWILGSFNKLNSDPAYSIKAVNFSAYGASFVHIDNNGKPSAPLYNYLKPYPQQLQKQFFSTHGNEQVISRQCASPVLGSLNSGLQLYRIKREQPQLFDRIAYSLHLPQYISFLFSSKPATDITSIGCHTMLWDFDKNSYHDWVVKEELVKNFADLKDGKKAAESIYNDKAIFVGFGLHDSSAALIPYLSSFREPFLLISTGTWCISLNPFNHEPLTDEELNQDCLCYLTFEGNPVKASRLFAGYHHENLCKNLSAYFNKPLDYYSTVAFDHHLLPADTRLHGFGELMNNLSGDWFNEIILSEFQTYEEAYHHLMVRLVEQQVRSAKLVLAKTSVKRIFIDGGFSKNPVYMQLLASAFPGIEIFAASMAQASAVGAAMAIHPHWNRHHLPNDIIDLKYYAAIETAEKDF